MHVSTLFFDSYLRLMSAHIGPSTSSSSSHASVAAHSQEQTPTPFWILAQPSVEMTLIRNGEEKNYFL